VQEQHASLAIGDLFGAPVLRAVAPLPEAPCPFCSSRTLHRSKARGLYERLRKAHTNKRLFRCRQCGWRGWLEPFDSAAGGLSMEPIELNLAGLDDLIDPPLASGGGDR
jgi:hypothetical protein